MCVWFIFKGSIIFFPSICLKDESHFFPQRLGIIVSEGATQTARREESSVVLNHYEVYEPQ